MSDPVFTQHKDGRLTVDRLPTRIVVTQELLRCARMGFVQRTGFRTARVVVSNGTAEYRAMRRGEWPRTFECQQIIRGREVSADEAAPWEYRPESLMVLCEDCHTAHTQIRDELNDLIGKVAVSAGMLEQVCGYVGAIEATQRCEEEPKASLIEAGSPEQLIGIAHFFGLTFKDVMDRVDSNEGLCVHELTEAGRARRREALARATTG